MEMSKTLWNDLSRVVTADPELMHQLRTAKDKESLIKLLTQVASAANISLDSVELEQSLASIPDMASLTESELETMAAGRHLMGVSEWLWLEILEKSERTGSAPAKKARHE